MDSGRSTFQSSSRGGFRETITVKSGPKTGYWKRPDDIQKNYAGHTQRYHMDDKTTHVLDIPYKRKMVNGYSGHLPNRHETTGAPSHLGPKDEPEEIDRGEAISNFRTFGKNMDTVERYTNAVEQLWVEHGQTPKMLLKLVQNKLAEKVHSYAEQKVAIRLLFQSHDVNQDFVLDEVEFRICMEKINIQFDDVQSLAIFAYFDTEYDGTLNWLEFADKCMVQNPKGGAAILPKAITATQKSGYWDDVMGKDV